VSRTQRSVVVVGAGLAGLVAAQRLKARGYQVAVIDRAKRAGGRAGSVRREGFVLEAVPPVLSPGDRRLLGWIGAVGLRDDLLPLRPLVSETAYRGRLAPSDVRRLWDVRRVPGVGLREAFRLVRLTRLLARYGERIDPQRPEAARDLDDRSLRDFGRLYFGDSVVEQWMAPEVENLSLGDADAMSRVQFLHHAKRHGGERFGLPRGALSDVTDRVAAELQVQLGLEVAGVHQGSTSPRVELRGGRSVVADAVVVATPAPFARALAAPVLSTAEDEGLAQVRYAHGLTLVAALCRHPASRPQRILVPRAEGSPLVSAVLEPGLGGSRAPEACGLASLRATADFAERHAEAPEDGVQKELVGALDALRPGFSSAIEFARVLRSTLAAPRFDVGRYREIDRFERVQRDRREAGRRVYFAGDYLVHPTFEGAVVSGERAAAAVCQDLA
jgi:oxygen-dependent protoporphyrinogen oxidase